MDMDNSKTFLDINGLPAESKNRLVQSLLVDMAKTAYKGYTGEKNASAFFIVQDNAEHKIMQQQIGNPIDMIELLKDSIIEIITDTHKPVYDALHLYEIALKIGTKANELANKYNINLVEEYEKFINEQ